MKSPNWANLNISPINYDTITYYSIPKQKKKLAILCAETNRDLCWTVRSFFIDLRICKQMNFIHFQTLDFKLLSCRGALYPGHSKFVGGADILRQLHDSGELKTMIEG